MNNMPTSINHMLFRVQMTYDTTDAGIFSVILIAPNFIQSIQRVLTIFQTASFNLNLIDTCLSLNMKAQKIQTEKNPYETANPFSKLVFIWILPFLKFGARTNLTLGDLYPVRTEDRTKELTDTLEKKWNEQSEKFKNSGKQPKLYKALIGMFWKAYLPIFIALLIAESTLRVAQPILFRRLISSFEQGNNDSSSNSNRYLYGGGLSLVTLAYALVYNMSTYNLFIIVMKCRVALSGLIYRKSLRLSRSSQAQASVGHLVNLLANDLSRIDNCIIFSSYIIIGPIQLTILSYVLFDQIGPSTMAGVGLLVLLFPLQYLIGKFTTIFRTECSKRTDERAKFTEEIIRGIRIIKMYAWEEPFSKLIQKLRRLEIKSLKKIAYLQACYLGMYNIAVKPVILLTIVAYWLTGPGSSLKADKVFYAIAIFNTMLHTMLIYFPYAAAGIGSAVVAIRRVQEFLLLPELETNVGVCLTTSPELKPESHGDGKICIQFDHLQASWIPSKPVLKGLNLNISGNQLVLIIGSVGSGKSSFLNILNSELPISSGKCYVNGSISFASQEPWIFSGTIRQNILLHRQYNETAYQKAIYVCALEHDISQFAHGDLTLVGERGVSLSGGQRARINLARAVYQKAGIYLLDDPLSAVDLSVSRHIFEECIFNHLGDSLRILVTHQIQYLPKADYIIVLKDGEIQAQGAYREFIAMGIELPTTEVVEILDDDREVDLNANSIKIRPKEEPKNVDESQEKKTREEELKKGSVTWKTYFDYLKRSNSLCTTLLVLIGFVLSQIIISSTDWWLSYWTTQQDQINFINYNGTLELLAYWSTSSQQPLGTIHLWIYMGLVGGTVLCVLVTITAFFKLSMTISANMHDSVFNSIVRAEAKFFDRNPSGRILNRLTRDFGSMDQLLPEILYDTIFIALKVIGSFIIVIIVNYYILAPTVLVLGGYYWIRSFYVKTVRDLKRIEAVSRSPLYTHLASSYQGITTIRISEAQVAFTEIFESNQDLNNSANFLLMSVTRWFAIWLELITIFYFAIVTFSFLLFSDYFPSGTVGLAIGSVMELSSRLQWGMRQSAELGNIMTSVERILEYTEIPSEAPLESDQACEKDWPPNGAIKFESVSLNYGTQPVLKNLSFTINAQEKVGIVGRTGAGKSSIFSALLRLTEPEGVITIDGVPTSTLGLHDLRQAISIIPQEPVLFSGSMRYNLDPFNQFKDHELWYALEEVAMKEAIQDLDMSVENGGSNFSVGERQLICLARALLRRNRIILMDEATANVDTKTDQFIQTYIRRNFMACTIITIAHRLDTIMDCDRVLVLDSGKLVEYDHPYMLLGNPDGFLSSLVMPSIHLPIPGLEKESGEEK